MSEGHPGGAGEMLDKARRETRAAFEDRAMMYANIYEELAGEIGAERAAELMKRAIRRRGIEIGQKYRPSVEAGDLPAVGEMFRAGSPSQGELFRPDVEHADENAVVLSMTACPLVDAWRRAGLSEDEVDTLCEIAAEVDFGMFEGAGLRLEFLERAGRPGSSRCLLRLVLPTS